jgi:hypothetical protein
MSAMRRDTFAARFKVWACLAVAAVFWVPSVKASDSDIRAAVTKIVTQIQQADYEGDRPELKRLYNELEPFVTDSQLASRVHYWRGFALWRKALNGFNDNAAPKELEEDLTQALGEFDQATAQDRGDVEAKIGTESCLGNLMFLNQKNPARVQELLARAVPLLKELRAEAPENPRMLWVLGPVLWVNPPERGGGHDKAMEAYEKGLELARGHKSSADPLEPAWGEPELLMSLAWSNLNRTAPNLIAAERQARAALELVPHWHYVRDILLRQIEEAKAKAKLK